MVINYGGVQFFKIQFGDIVLAINPVSKESKIKIKEPRFQTDIALISLNHPDMNGVSSLSGKDDDGPFVVEGPGEYEIKDVFIEGFESESEYGGEKRINTIYKILLEGMTICFLGALGKPKVDSKVLEEFDEIDILFTPIGGDGVLKASEAYKFSLNMSPKVIIPMHFGRVGDKDSLKKFFKEEGEKEKKPADKLTIKKSDLTGLDGEIMVLEES